MIIIPSLILSIPSVQSNDEPGQMDLQLDQTYDAKTKSDYSVSSIPVTLNFDLNVVFLGFNSSIIDETSISSQLPQWHAPIDRFKNHFNVFENPFIPLSFDVNYTINYNFQYATQQDLQDYQSFIATEGTLQSTGGSYAFYGVNDSSLEKGYYVPSYMVEEFLGNKFYTTTPTIVIIDTYSHDPPNFVPHFYNNSYTDFDHPNGGIAREYATEQQIAGGGGEIPLLFVDFSAGPNTDAISSGIDHIHTYFQDLTNSTQVDIVNDGIAYDIQTALELRFLPSNLYSPIAAYHEIQLDIVLLDFQKADQFNTQFAYPIPNDNHNFLNSIDVDHVVKQLSAINPFINWTYSTSEYDWSSDPQLKSVILNNINPIDAVQGSIDSSSIMDFLDIYYQEIFLTSTNEKIVLPMFLFGMPGRYTTNFGGVANGDDIGDFKYIITAKNVYAAQGIRYKFPLTTNSGTVDSITNSFDYFGFYSSYSQNEETETSMSITGSLSANVTLEILDYFNFIRWSDSLSYTPLYTITNLKGGDNLAAFNISATDAFDAFFWVISNDQTNSADYSISVDRYRTDTTGMTHVALHEASHAVGMSHPHDGFSWLSYIDNQYYCNDANSTDGLYGSCNGEYVEWLWDQSSTYMSYATTPHTMGNLDWTAMQRSTSFQYLQDLQTDIKNYMDILFSQHEYVPQPFVSDFEQMISLYEESLSLFTAHQYNSSITKSFTAREHLITLEQLEYNVSVDFVLTLTGLDNIAVGEYLDIAVETGNRNSYYQVGDNTIITIKFKSWENVTITVTYKGTVLHSINTMTWLISSINVDTSSIPSLILPTTSVISTTTTTTTTTSTQISTTTIISAQESSTNTSENSKSSESPIVTTWFVLGISLILLVNRKKIYK